MRRLWAASIATAFVVASGAQAAAVDASLPGGIGIAVGIETPLPDTVVPKGTVTVVGTASVGTGAVPPRTSVTYVLDGSTSLAASGYAAEKAAVDRFHRQFAMNPGYGIGSVGLATFASDAATVDVGSEPGVQLATGPTTDADGAGGPDFLAALRDLPWRQGSTNFSAGLEAATEVAAATTGARKLVLFLSDGHNNVGTSADIQRALAAVPPEVDVHSFAFGPDATCQAHLGDIARTTGGTCSESEFANLGEALSRLLASELHHLRLTVDGGPELPITAITPVLPQPGPKQVRYTVETPPLDVGNHPLCVTAHGSDFAGQGKVTDCTNVIVLEPGQPPTSSPVPPTAGPTTPGSPLPPGALPGNGQVSVIPRGGVATGDGTLGR